MLGLIDLAGAQTASTVFKSRYSWFWVSSILDAGRTILCQSVQSLSEFLAPAPVRGPELEVVIGKLFADFNVYTGDEGKPQAQIAVWTEEL